MGVERPVGMSTSLCRGLMWVRLLSLMALPALGSAGLLFTLEAATPGDVLARTATIFGAGVVGIVIFIGFTASVFSFPTRLPKALAVTLLTPGLILATTLLLDWGPWQFCVDECFAELGGMALGAAVAAVVAGGGGIGVRILGALVFAGAGAGAVWLFGAPMLEGGEIDPVWAGLNALALAWSFYTYYEVFAAHGRAKAAGEGAPVDDRLRPASGIGLVVALALLGWLAALGGAAALIWP